jgi:ATP-dependent helicase HrpB
VPLLLLEWARERQTRILLLEPRRIAAIAAAEFMSRQLGLEVGVTVGYRTRAAAKVSSTAIIEVVTEGILTRMLIEDPALTRYGIVIFDEFHERSIHADVGLALCLQSQEALREDLKLLVMSATVDLKSLLRIMPNAATIEIEAPCHPIEIRYRRPEPRARIEETVRSAVGAVVQEVKGDILVFLPGGKEIRDCARTLSEDPRFTSFEIASLSGETPLTEQRRLLADSERGRPRITLSTNLAETSLTIPRVSTVIDSGLARVAEFDHARGIPRLVTSRITQASATQRAGRAGRLGSGLCVRLWSQAEQATLTAFSLPEIVRSDLASILLNLAEWGERDIRSIKLLDYPPSGAIQEGWELLKRLGAVDESCRITALGRKMSAFGVHPRIASMLIRAAASGIFKAAAEIAAIIEEDDAFRASPDTSVLSNRWELLKQHRHRNRLSDHHSSGAWDRVSRAAERLERHLRSAVESVSDQVARVTTGRSCSPEVTTSAGILAAWAYPDRIAQRRGPSDTRYVLANGTGAQVPEGSYLSRHEFLVAIKLVGAGPHAKIHLAEPIDLTILEELALDLGTTSREVFWEEASAAVRGVRRERIGAVILRESTCEVEDEEARRQVVAFIRSRGLGVLPWSKEALRFKDRVCWIKSLEEYRDQFPDLSDPWLRDHLDMWLMPFLGGVKSLKRLTQLDLMHVLSAQCDYSQLRLLDDVAPESIALPSGSKASISYSSGPSIEVPLQEMFGMKDVPRVAGGRRPITVTLLSPARRPLQVTTDLASFWNTSYPAVRGEMRSRYPKHEWPEDPLGASPSKGKVRRR